MAAHGPTLTSGDVRYRAAVGGIADITQPNGPLASPLLSRNTTRMQRELAELELFALEQRVAVAERRAIEARHHQRATSSASNEVAVLRGEVAELGRACNEVIAALLSRIEQQDAELAALRGRVEGVEGRTRTGNRAKATSGGKAKSPVTMPSFLPSRHLS
jgi:hypothetical protein